MRRIVLDALRRRPHGIHCDAVTNAVLNTLRENEQEDWTYAQAKAAARLVLLDLEAEGRVEVINSRWQLV